MAVAWRYRDRRNGGAFRCGRPRHRLAALSLGTQHIRTVVGPSAREVPMLARAAANSPFAIGSALDAGTDGVLVPMIETAEQAAAAVSAARFPPRGHRSGGGVRPLSMGFGTRLPGESRCHRQNAERKHQVQASIRLVIAPRRRSLPRSRRERPRKDYTAIAGQER